MKTVTSLLKKLQLRRILTIFLAGVLVLVSTACNSGDTRNAATDNLPVQVGGANNPYKGGGNTYTQNKMSTDPSVNTKTTKRVGDRADAQLNFNQLIAASGEQDLLYPGSGANSSKLPEIIPGSEKVLEAPQIPAQPQPIVKRTDPDAKILERAGETFKDASAFIKDKADEAGARPEAQSNPARH